TVLSSPDFPEPLEVPTLFGGLSRRRVQGEGRSYNTAFLTNARGEIVGTYDKTYLLAFGEYLPLGDVFPILYEWSPNTGRFTPGDHVRALAHGSMRITTLVCYEDVLPAFTRRAVAENTPNLLVNITNDAWFGDTREPWIHLALAKFRAVEHHRALVRATNSGVSAFVDPVGRTLDTIAVGERDQLVAELPLLDENTVYTSLGDWPAYLGAPLIAFLAFRRRRDA
ncbi:MAG: apolipoprotein N-acyltransferase, partial [Myxococcota bacterium]